MSGAETSLDRLCAEAAKTEAGLRRYCAALAEARLVLLLERPAVGDKIDPQLIKTDTGPAVAAFDSEAQLAAHAGGPAAYAAMPGRVLAPMLAGSGLALAVNPGSPSAMVLGPDTLAELAARLEAPVPAPVSGAVVAMAPLAELDPDLAEAARLGLAEAGGLVTAACLVRGTFEDGEKGPVLVLAGVPAKVAPALVLAVNETVRLSLPDRSGLDVLILRAGDPREAEALAVGQPVPLPPAPAQRAEATALGSDPDRPPRLR
jgi:hypothetical protein